MAGKDLKRGSEQMNLETEKESSMKQLKLSARSIQASSIRKGTTQKINDAMCSAIYPTKMTAPGRDPTDPRCEQRLNLSCSCDGQTVNNNGSHSMTANRDLTNEDEKEKSDDDDGFVDLTEEFREKPGVDEEYEHVEPVMSDDWTAMMWRNKSSDLQVVTKSSYSCDWIKEILKSNIFGYTSDGKADKLEICRNEKNKCSVSSCSSVLFCFDNDEWDSKLLKEVKDLSFYLGMKKVIILLSEKTPDNCFLMKDRDDFPVLNFSRHQVTWYKNNLQFYNGKMEAMKSFVKGSAPWMGQKIGIFSRSSESEFEWLKTELKSGCFRDVVEDVGSYYISNKGFQQFMTDVSNCSFGILYHTKNRGRINITDVTDSLYDEELHYMSGMLNKEVIVVVDDLQNGNDEEKSRIQNSQPTIGKEALDLFLFTTDEKKFLEPLVKMRNLINGENK